jgi:hypothetical protein
MFKLTFSRFTSFGFSVRTQASYRGVKVFVKPVRFVMGLGV